MASAPIPYGTLPRIVEIEIINNQVLFTFANADVRCQLADDFPIESPIGIWLRELEDLLLQDQLMLYHGYGCDLDGKLMTGPCKTCEDAQKAF